MKKFDNKNGLVRYICGKMLAEDSITAIVDYDMVNDISDILEGNCDISYFSKDIHSLYNEYVIDKYVMSEKDKKFALEIFPIEYDENGELDTVVYNNYILLFDGILEDEALNEIQFEEELEILKLYDNQDKEHNCENCPDKYECEDYITEEQEDERLLHFNELSDDQKEYIELCCEEVLDSPMSQLME